MADTGHTPIPVVMTPEVMIVPQNVLDAYADQIAEQVSAMETKRLTTPALDEVMSRNGWTARAVVLGTTFAARMAAGGLDDADRAELDWWRQFRERICVAGERVQNVLPEEPGQTGQHIESGRYVLAEIDPDAPVYLLTESELGAVMHAAHIEATAGYGVPSVEKAVTAAHKTYRMTDKPIEPIR